MKLNELAKGIGKGTAYGIILGLALYSFESNKQLRSQSLYQAPQPPTSVRANVIELGNENGDTLRAGIDFYSNGDAQYYEESTFGEDSVTTQKFFENIYDNSANIEELVHDVLGQKRTQ